MEILVPAKVLAAARLFAAENDIRFYLCGISLEIGRGETRIIATDGALLGCFRVESAQPTVKAPINDVIIPNALLTGIKPAAGDVLITLGAPFAVSDDKGAPLSYPVTLTQGGVVFGGNTIAGVYPDYRRVIPRRVSGECAHFDARLIAKLAKIEAILNGKGGLHVVIGHNGPGGAALVRIEGQDNFIGVLMPLRPKAVQVWTEAPAWAHDPRLGAPVDADADADADDINYLV